MTSPPSPTPEASPTPQISPPTLSPETDTPPAPSPETDTPPAPVAAPSVDVPAPAPSKHKKTKKHQSSPAPAPELLSPPAPPVEAPGPSDAFAPVAADDQVTLVCYHLILFFFNFDDYKIYIYTN